jgi:hypothetical protein
MSERLKLVVLLVLLGLSIALAVGLNSSYSHILITH